MTCASTNSWWKGQVDGDSPRFIRISHRRQTQWVGHGQNYPGVGKISIGKFSRLTVGTLEFSRAFQVVKKTPTEWGGEYKMSQTNWTNASRELERQADLESPFRVVDWPGSRLQHLTFPTIRRVWDAIIAQTLDQRLGTWRRGNLW